VRNSAGKAFYINIIDTPGLFEVRSASGEKRTNEQILKLVESALRAHVTSISAIFLLFPVTNVFNEEALETLSVVSAFLGESFNKNSVLLFTKADTFQLETLQSRVSEFLSSKVSHPFVEFCQGGIYFTGAAAGEMVAEYGEVYDRKAKHKVACLRQYLIDAIVGFDDVPLPPSFWPPRIEKPVPVAAPPASDSMVTSPSKSSGLSAKPTPTTRSSKVASSTSTKGSTPAAEKEGKDAKEGKDSKHEAKEGKEGKDAKHEAKEEKDKDKNK